MLHLTTETVRAFVNTLQPSGGYHLTDVTLDIPDPRTVVFKAKLNGPVSAPVWALAWLSTAIDGTLAEAASPQLTAGDEVVLTVRLNDGRVPQQAYMRIESAPLRTEHVVCADVR
jgi:hypothetical protein